MTSAVAQKIGVSLSAFEHQFLVKIREAMEEKAKDLGVQIQFVEAQGQSLGQMRWSGADAARHDSYLHPANLASWIALARRCGQCDLSSIRVAATFVGMGSSTSTVGFRAGFGWNQKTMLFASAIVLTLVAFAGGLIVKAILRLTKPGKVDADSDARKTPTPRSHQRLRRPNGSELQVEFYGPRMGIPIILTHGWGLDSREWNHLKRELSDRFRLIVRDEPGLGKSTRPTNRDYNLKSLAHDLQAVLALAGDKPAILLGHSIGGMITLTFCDLFPALLGSRIIGLVLMYTTPTDPVRTTSGGGFFTAIEKPVLVPLMYLTIALSPLVWLMNWLSYLNGSAHLSTKQSSFAGTETWEQIDFFTSFQPQASPAV